MLITAEFSMTGYGNPPFISGYGYRSTRRPGHAGKTPDQQQKPTDRRQTPHRLLLYQFYRSVCEILPGNLIFYIEICIIDKFDFVHKIFQQFKANAAFFSKRGSRFASTGSSYGSVRRFDKKHIETGLGGYRLEKKTQRWFQNHSSGFRSRWGEKFNRLNTLSI